MISKEDLITEIQYKGAKIGEEFMLIGFVEVKHGDTLVFHQLLTQRSMDEVAGLTAEEIQALAENEASEILAGEASVKCCEQYVQLVNLGLY